MAAWADDDYRDDRAEALGEARTYYGHPEPCDDAFWLGVNVRADAIAQATEAALAAVDEVIALLPGFHAEFSKFPPVEGEPTALTAPRAPDRVATAPTGQPSSPSAPERAL